MDKIGFGVDLFAIDTVISATGKHRKEKDLLRNIAMRITKIPPTVRRYT